MRISKKSLGTTCKDLKFTNLLLSNQLEVSIDGILAVNGTGEIIFYNNKFINMWDIPPEVMRTFSDQNAVDFVLNKVADPLLFAKNIQTLYDNKTEQSKDEILLLDGRTFERYSAPMIGAKNVYYGRVWYFRDITGQKQAGQALQESVDRFRLLSEAVFDGIAITDLGYFVDANTQLLEMLNYSRDEIIGKLVSDIVAPQSRKKVMQHIKSWSEEAYEHYLQKKDGSIFPVLSRARAMLLNGEKYRVTVITDITERKSAEEVLKNQSKKLKNLSLRLSEVQEIERKFISHELHDRIGQNLTALGLNISILSSIIPQADQMRSVRERLEDSMKLIQETTEYTRNLMAELRPPVMDDFGLMASLKWYCRLFSYRTGIDFICYGDDLLPRPEPNIEATIFRIVQEALNNVSKHSQAKIVEISGLVVDNKITLVITDDGIGFDLDKVNMNMGHQGWGLKTMMERAELIGGRIVVKSQPGHGTSIFIEVPM